MGRLQHDKTLLPRRRNSINLRDAEVRGQKPPAKASLDGREPAGKAWTIAMADGRHRRNHRGRGRRKLFVTEERGRKSLGQLDV
jgi:hypothetical protein